MTNDQDLGPEAGADEGEDESRSVLEGLMPGLLKGAIVWRGSSCRRAIRETIVADAVRKAISKGGEVVDQTEESVRNSLGRYHSVRNSLTVWQVGLTTTSPE